MISHLKRKWRGTSLRHLETFVYSGCQPWSLPLKACKKFGKHVLGSRPLGPHTTLSLCRHIWMHCVLGFVPGNPSMYATSACTLCVGGTRCTHKMCSMDFFWNWACRRISRLTRQVATDQQQTMQGREDDLQVAH